MTVKELRAAEAAANAAVQAAADSIDALTDEASVEDIDAAQRAFDAAVETATAAKAAVERAAAIAEARAAFPAPQAPPAEHEAPEAEKRADVRVTRNESQYRPDSGDSFFKDMRAAKHGDAGALERLSRNTAEVVDDYRAKGRVHELRDVTTGGPGADGFVPPLYLSSLYVDMPREGRASVDIFPKVPLPPQGMTVTIPRLITEASVNVQHPQGQALSETDIDTEQITVPINTIGGLQDITLQAWERTDPAMDALMMAELTSLYDQRLDLQILAGSGTNVQHTGLTTVASTNSVTYTDGTPTGAELAPKLYDAIQQIRTLRFSRATHIIMHPRRAAWLASALSSTFPLLQQGGFNQALGSQNQGTTLSFAGLPVIEDANVGTAYGASTDEDEIYVVHAPSSPFMESALRFDVHDQPLGNELKVRVRVFAYSAFASTRYPKSISIIGGTGLKTPSF